MEIVSRLEEYLTRDTKQVTRFSSYTLDPGSVMFGKHSNDDHVLNEPCLTSSENRQSNRNASAQEFLSNAVVTLEILYMLGSPDPRMQGTQMDFINGTRGAPKLNGSEFRLVSRLYNLLSVGRRTLRSFSFDQLRDPTFQQASQHFTCLLEGRMNKVDGTNSTYFQAKGLVQRIVMSGYLDNNRPGGDQTSAGVNPENPPTVITLDTSLLVDPIQMESTSAEDFPNNQAGVGGIVYANDRTAITQCGNVRQFKQKNMVNTNNEEDNRQALSLLKGPNSARLTSRTNLLRSFFQAGAEKEVSNPITERNASFKETLARLMKAEGMTGSQPHTSSVQPKPAGAVLRAPNIPPRRRPAPGPLITPSKKLQRVENQAMRGGYVRLDTSGGSSLPILSSIDRGTETARTAHSIHQTLPTQQPASRISPNGQRFRASRQRNGYRGKMTDPKMMASKASHPDAHR